MSTVGSYGEKFTYEEGTAVPQGSSRSVVGYSQREGWPLWGWMRGGRVAVKKNLSSTPRCPYE